MNAKTIGYLRVSTNEQDLKNQKLAILDYSHENKIEIDDFIEIKSSSRKSTSERGIDDLLESLNSGDRLIVSELSRLGRSVGQVIRILDTFSQNRISFISIKEGIAINGKQDIQTKVMTTMFSLFAELERDLISQRTKEALKARKAQGVSLGRPKGPGKSKLDKHREEIIKQLNLGVPKTRIAEHFSTSDFNLRNWMKKNKIHKEMKLASMQN